jgi:hypothetical protein
MREWLNTVEILMHKILIWETFYKTPCLSPAIRSYYILYAISAVLHLVTRFKVTTTNQCPKDCSQTIYFYLWSFCLVHSIWCQQMWHSQPVNGQTPARLKPNMPRKQTTKLCTMFLAHPRGNPTYIVSGSSRSILKDFTSLCPEISNHIFVHWRVNETNACLFIILKILLETVNTKHNFFIKTFLTHTVK